MPVPESEILKFILSPSSDNKKRIYPSFGVCLIALDKRLYITCSIKYGSIKQLKSLPEHEKLEMYIFLFHPIFELRDLDYLKAYEKSVI